MLNEKFVPTKIALLSLVLTMSSISFGSSGITYHGRILKPDSSPVTSSTTQFRIQVRTPGAENCLLWEEQQTKDLSSTNGVFTVTINDTSEPSLITNALPFALERVFSNRTAFTALTGCSAGNSYTPSSSFDGRTLQVFFRENPADSWEQMPATKVNFVPLALNSVQLEGYQANEFLKIDPLSSYTTLSAANVNTLVDIIAGTSNQYLRPATVFAGDVTGTYNSTVVERIRGTGVTATVPTSGQVLKYDGTNWAPAADDVGASIGDASYAAKGIVQINTDQATSGLFIASGVLAMPNVIAAAGPTGDASNIPVLTYDAKGRLTAVSTATVDDTSKLPLAGGTMSGSLNMGAQTITNAASVSANDFSGRNFYHYNLANSQYANIKAPDALGLNYTLTLPTTAPVAGNVLSTDASGNLSWIAAASGSVTSISSTNSYLTVAGTASVPTLTVNVGTAVNTVAAGDDSRITGALQQAAYNVDVADVATCTGAEKPYWNTISDQWSCVAIGTVANATTAVNFSGNLAGDVTGTQGATVVERIRGTNVAITALADDHILQFDGTNYVNKLIPTCGASEYITFNGTAWTCAADAGAGGGLTSLGGQTGSSQTFASGATGTAPAFSSAANVHTLNIPLAAGAGVTSGTISKTEYDSFVAKLTSPLTTKGDLLSRDGATHVRLPVGTDGQILSANSAEASGLQWIAAPSGDITEVVAGAGLTGGATSGSATVDVVAGTGIVVNANDVAVDVGIADGQIVQVQTGGKLPVLDGSDLTNLDAGDIASGTLPIARGGTGQTSANAALNALLPNQATHGSKVLQTDGTNTSWVTPAAGTVTSISSTNSYLTVAGTASVPTLTVNVGTAVNTVAAGDDSRITGALQQAAYNVDVADVATCTGAEKPYWNTISDKWSCVAIGTVANATTAVNFSGSLAGDVTGTQGATVVERIRGTNVAITALADDHILQFNGTNYVNKLIPTCGASEYITFDGTSWTCAADAGAGGGLTSLGGQTGSSQTFANGATGTAPAFSSATNVHTLNIPLASGAGVTSGTISKTEYDSFVAKLTSPLTTKGDLLSRDGSTHVRLPAGTNGQVLSANSATASGLEWVAASSGDITDVVAGAGLTGGASSGSATVDVVAGTGIVVNANDVAVDVGLAANKIPQVGSSALGANGVIVANGTATALTSLNCTLNQIIKFDASGFATCGSDVGSATSFIQDGNSFAAAATLGTNDNYALNFETNGTTKMTVLANGNVGIGTPSPTYKLTVSGLGSFSETLTDPTVDGNGLISNLTVSPTASASSQTYFGSVASIQSGNANAIGTLIGSNGTVSSAFGNVTNLIGGSFQSSVATNTVATSNYGSQSLSSMAAGTGQTLTNSYGSYGNSTVFFGNITNSYGGYFLADQAALAIASTVTSGYGVYGEVKSTGSRTVTNGYGVYAAVTPNGGTITNRYGVYVADTGSGANYYNIYSAGSAKNYFSGSVGIGTTTPATKLQVAGTIKVADGAETCTIAGDGGMIRYSGTSLQFCNGTAWQTVGISGSGLTSLGGQTGSTQTFANGATGTAPAFSSATNVHTLNIPLAAGAGVTSGTISKTDYDSFVAKLTSPLTTKGDLLSRDGSTHVRLPAGTNGQILSANSATASGLEWIAAPTLNALLPSQTSNANKVLQTDGTNTSWVALLAGTAGKLTKFTSATAVGDSIITESGSQITVAGQIAANVNNAGASTTINFNSGNAAYTTATCAAMTLQNMIDGGSYSVAVKSTSGTCSFAHGADDIHYAGGVSNVTITAHTVFTFIKMGTDVYVTWVSF